MGYLLKDNNTDTKISTNNCQKRRINETFLKMNWHNNLLNISIKHCATNFNFLYRIFQMANFCVYIATVLDHAEIYQINNWNFLICRNSQCVLFLFCYKANSRSNHSSQLLIVGWNNLNTHMFLPLLNIQLRTYIQTNGSQIFLQCYTLYICDIVSSVFEMFWWINFTQRLFSREKMIFGGDNFRNKQNTTNINIVNNFSFQIYCHNSNIFLLFYSFFFLILFYLAR